MSPRDFKPGFRLSTVDVLVLVIGAVATAVLWPMTWWWGFVVGFVLAHFFFFCNVIRAARPLELAWAGVFLVCAAGTIALEIPGWPVTMAASLATTLAVTVLEMRKPSYHGAGWATINPNLRNWRDAQQAHSKTE